jgi:hypothetical protein
LDADGDMDIVSVAENEGRISWFENVSGETDFLSFSFAEELAPATINVQEHSIGIEVTNAADLGDLTATFTLSSGATVNIEGTPQSSGVTPNSFESTVVYTVVASDGTEQDWIVNVRKPNALRVTQVTQDKVQPGQSLDVHGYNLDNTPANNTLTLGGQSAVVTSASINHLQITVPSLSPGYHPLVVTNGNGTFTYSEEILVTAPFEESVGFTLEQIDQVIGGSVQEVLPMDVDRDGDQDVIVVLAESILWFSNLGDGTFDIPISSVVYEGVTGNLHLGDVNADGLTDIAFTYSYSVNYLRNNGDATFEHRSQNFDISLSLTSHLSDVNSDGYLDIVTTTSGTIIWLENDGSGYFDLSANYEINSTSNYPMYVGDLTGDNLPDIVDSRGYLYRNQGGGDFSDNTSDRVSSQLGTIGAMDAADMDMDGDVDLVVASQSQDFVALLNNEGTASFETFIYYVNSTVNSPRAVTIVDLDGDQDLDVLYSAGVNSLDILWAENDGSNNFSEPSSSPIIEDVYLSSLRISDFNGDGAPDIITTNQVDEKLTWFSNKFHAKNFTAFSLAEQISPATINTEDRTVVIEVDNATDVSMLIPAFTVTTNATVDINEVTQQSSITPNDFSEALIYTITAEDGSVADWTVKVIRSY